MEKYYGFDLLTDTLDGREIKIVFPEESTKNGRWILKTEYFDAFPETEIELVKKGYHIAHIKNITRWHMPEDTDARAALAEHMHTKYGLSKKCVIVGMSCGGMQGIYFGAKYPEYVSCMYLDAPVVNLLSCPGGLCGANDNLFEEFKQAKGMGLDELISYREHPLDYIPRLAENNIPIVLVYGDEDKTVPYKNNGKLLEEYYKNHNLNIKTLVRHGGHHPHGLDDNTPIIDFILENDK